MEVSTSTSSAVSKAAKSELTKTANSASTSQSTNGENSATDETNAASQTTSTSAPVATVSDEFTEFMKKALGSGTKSQVSEEELFSALVEERLDSRKPEMAEAFRMSRDELNISMRKSDGFLPAEEIALRALQKISEAGVISQEEAEKVSGEAFAGAQLDSDSTTLYDSRGGAGDPTIAVAAIAEAIAKSKAAVDGLEKEASTISPRPIESMATGVAGVGSASSAGSSTSGSSADTTPGEQKIDGNGGFLWKPVSESDGKLAVLLPEEFSGEIAKVEVHSKMPTDSSSLVDSGRYAGSHESRPIFRFHKPGAAMGDDLFVVVTKDDGNQAWWPISDGGKRTD